MQHTKHVKGAVLAAAAIGFILSSATPVAALEKEFIEKKIEAKKVKHDGWDGGLTVASGLSLSNNQSVVGQTDGTLFTLGLSFDGGLEYFRGSHEWRNTLTLAEMFSRTPAIDRFVKTNDELKLDSIYLYHLRSLPWFGPFGRLGVATAILAGRDVRSASNTYLVRRANGNLETSAGDSLHLTDPFRPFLIKESIGAFAKPVDKPQVGVEFRLGLGGRQVIADGQFALDDVKDTPQIEVKELQTYAQLGAEAGVYVNGTLQQDKVSYTFLAEAMTPFARSNSTDSDKNAFEQTNLEVGLKLSFKLVSWASLDYQFRTVRQPQLVDAFQIQNLLLINFSYTLVRRAAVEEPKKDG